MYSYNSENRLSKKSVSLVKSSKKKGANRKVLGEISIKNNTRKSIAIKQKESTIISPPDLVFEDIYNASKNKSEIYNNEIYDYFLKREKEFMLKGDYLSNQKEIDNKMRSILIDWLIDVHLKFKLQQKTLFLTVSIIDRYLSKSEIKKKNFQLLGVTSLLLASKYEEIYFPQIRDLIEITDNTYRRPKILKMEQKIIKALNFDFTYPTMLCFIQKYLEIVKEGRIFNNIVYYLSEKVLQEYVFILYVKEATSLAHQV